MAEFTLSRALAQDAKDRIHAHGSWHYARITAMSTVTDRRTTGMVLKEKKNRGSSIRRVVVHRLNDNEDGTKGAAEKAGRLRYCVSLSVSSKALVAKIDRGLCVLTDDRRARG